MKAPSQKQAIGIALIVTIVLVAGALLLTNSFPFLQTAVPNAPWGIGNATQTRPGACHTADGECIAINPETNKPFKFAECNAFGKHFMPGTCPRDTANFYYSVLTTRLTEYTCTETPPSCSEMFRSQFLVDGKADASGARIEACEGNRGTKVGSDNVQNSKVRVGGVEECLVACSRLYRCYEPRPRQDEDTV